MRPYLAVALAVLSLVTYSRSAAPVLAQESVSRAPVPSEKEQSESITLIREVYKSDFDSAKLPADKQALAKKLLAKAGDSKGDPTGRFVLLKLVGDIGAQSGDVAMAFRAVDEMAREYDIDGLTVKTGILVNLGGKARLPAQHKSIVEEALQLIAHAISEGNFEVAERLGVTALGSVRQAGDPALTKRLRARMDDVSQIAKSYEEVKSAAETLKAKPLDPEANLIVGKYLCLTKGNWDEGLPMLALGENPTLKAIASRELEGATTADEQAKLGDAWWAQAERAEGIAKEQMLGRAVFWYRQALPGLNGLAKDKVERRLKEQPAWRLTKGGFPLVAGQWSEGAIPVSIIQREGALTALCEYRHEEFGLIRWRYDATITKEGKISGTLIHTQAPASWKQQTRTAQLTPDGQSIVGKAMWDGGGSDFEWGVKGSGK